MPLFPSSLPTMIPPLKVKEPMLESGELRSQSSNSKSTIRILCVILVLYLVAIGLLLVYLETRKNQNDVENVLLKCLTSIPDLKGIDKKPIVCTALQMAIQQRLKESVSQQLNEKLSDISDASGNPMTPGEALRATPHLRAAAHLTGIRPSLAHLDTPVALAQQVRGELIAAWESVDGSATLRHMSYEPGTASLRVLRPGLYYVYAQVYFRYRQDMGRRGLHTPKPRHHMVQYLYKKNSYPEPLLLAKGGQTKCWSQDADYGLYSIYLGGVFHLHMNDRLFLSVTDASLIDHNQEASFFGAFQID
uniref:tumor necrosis factor ligand superfamily member 10-like n=1 Tax=Myxine glutinosa TaxID=7769 RepID=UPI00358EA4D5